MSVQWYYIDGAGTTVGPVQESKIIDLWCSDQLTGESYVWNGTTVNEWLGISSVGFLHSKLKGEKAKRNKPAPRANPPRPAGGPARPKKKAGGGARMNLLDSIRSGKQLKKVEKKDLPQSSGPGGAAKKPVGKMSLQDQLKMKLSKGRTGGPAKKKTTIPKKNTGSSGPSWRDKQKAKENEPKKLTWSERQALKKKEEAAAKAKPSGGYGGAGKTPSKIDLKSKIDKCNEDWILKAIDKLLS